MVFYLTRGIVVLILVWLVVMYNGLISLKNQVQNAWQQIDVQLKRRHDLIPNLVNAVRGAMQFERATLERVIAARNRAVGARSPGHGVARARQLYNDLVAQFNTRQEVFPANLMAAPMGFKPADYFQVEAADRAVPSLDL